MKVSKNIDIGASRGIPKSTRGLADEVAEVGADAYAILTVVVDFSTGMYE